MPHVTKENNPIFNAISAHCEEASEELRMIRERMEAEYWAQHRALAEHGFSNSHSQREAMDRLGRLAAAIAAVDAAHGATSKGRCW